LNKRPKITPDLDVIQPGLIDQTHSIERGVKALGLDQIAFEGSDSLDDPGAVFE